MYAEENWALKHVKMIIGNASYHFEQLVYVITQNRTMHVLTQVEYTIHDFTGKQSTLFTYIYDYRQGRWEIIIIGKVKLRRDEKWQ